MFLKRPPIEFVASARPGAPFPAPLKFEVAFTGRSNVGKSSLINALTGVAKLARVSKTPGCTRAVNFFKAKGNFYLVDLPGYGFAKAPKEETKAFRGLMNDYFDARGYLMRGALLIDVRRGVTDLDAEMVEMFVSREIPFLVAATKIDKLGKNDLIRALKAMRADGRIAGAEICPVSVTSYDGVVKFDKALDRLAAVVAIDPPADPL